MEPDIYEEDNSPWYAVLGGLIAGLCSSTVVSNLIKTNVSMPATLKNKITLLIGSAAISAVVSAATSKQAESDISELSDLIKGWIKAFKKGGEDAGRSGERNTEESATKYVESIS